jgi:hypothetical protein
MTSIFADSDELWVPRKYILFYLLNNYHLFEDDVLPFN